MKITLYTPDGTAETFSGCTVQDGISRLLTFTGVDWNGTLRKKVTSLPYVIEIETAAEVVEVFALSPLVQDNIPTTKQ